MTRSVDQRLKDAAWEGVITMDEAKAIGRAFIEHGGVTEIRLESLTDDEREALDRVCVWIEKDRQA